MGNYMSYWVDKTGQASLDDARKQRWWVDVRGDVPNLGVTSHPHWFRLEVQRPVYEESWLMEIGYALLDYVDVYLVTAEGELLQHYSVGMRRPIENRPIIHRFNIIPLPNTKDANYHIYLRVQSFHSMQLPISFWPSDDFVAHDEFNNLAVGILAGALCIMLLYNFFLYTTVREPIYLAYVGAVTCFLLLQFGLKGFGYRYLWSDQALWSSLSVFFSGLCAVFFASTFALLFLRLKEKGFKYYQLVNVLRWTALVCAVATPWIPPDWILMVLAVISLSIVCLGFNAIFTYYRAGDRPIQIFAAGWTIFLIGVLLILFNKFGLIPVNVWTEHTISFGTVFEMILFSMALGDLINTEKEQTLKAKSQLLHALDKERESKQQRLRNEEMERNAKEITLRIQRENNLKLEQEVDARTQELQCATEKLQELVKIDPLTEVFNRHYFNEQIQEECFRAVREQRELTLMMIDVDHFKSINDSYGHMVGDECLKVVSKALAEMVKQAFGAVYRYGGEEFAVIFPGMKLSSAKDMAESLRAMLASDKINVPNGPAAITASIGLLTKIPNQDERPEDLIEAADEALYRAKRNGRNRVVVAMQDGSKQRA